jgi:hypothetical protein
MLRRGLSFGADPYSQFEEAVRRQDWQNPAMKSLPTAGIV